MLASTRWSIVLALLSLAIAVAVSESTTSRHILGRRRHPHRIPKEWMHIGDIHDHHMLKFAVRLRHQNLDKMHKLFAHVSNPKSPLYGRHLTREEADALIAPEPEAFDKVHAWLKEHNVPDAAVHRSASALHVRTDVLTASKLFDTTFTQFQHRRKGHKAVRQVGTFSIPRHLKEHVSLVTGLSELHPGTGRAQAYQNGDVLVSERDNKESSPSPTPDSFKPTEKPKASPVPVKEPAKPIKVDYSRVLADDLLFAAATPWAVRDYYKVPRSARGVSKANKQAVVGFNDLFDAPSLTVFQHEMGLTVTNISNHVMGEGANSTTAHEEESDLDVQYLIGVGQGVETWFFQQGPEDWLLEWLDSVIAMGDPPLVYSISYGWPEEDQCYNSETDGSLVECDRLGYNSEQYVQEANVKLEQLGLRGLTIITSSGDDGAPGQSWNVPLEPQPGTKCPQMAIEKEDDKCFFPLVANSCFQLLHNDSDCARAIREFKDYHESKCDLKVAGLLAADRSRPFMSSKCECDAFKTFTSGKCKVGPYSYDRRNGMGFQPDFPASSPFVTTVGATTFARAPRPICRLNGVLCPRGEVATSAEYAHATITTGGGFAVYSPMPNYQEAAVKGYIKHADDAGELPPRAWFKDENRGYPDVAAIGTKCETVVSAQSGLVPMDGTSCSAPIFAGMVSLINDKLIDAGRSTLGFLNPFLYQAALAHPESFNDITMGESSCAGRIGICAESGWKSYAGWDPLTGLGSPNYFELERYILSHPAVTATDVAAYNDDSGSDGSADEAAADAIDLLLSVGVDARAKLGVQVMGDDVDPYLTRPIVWAFAFGFFVFILIPAGALVFAYFKLSAAIASNKDMYGDADDEEFHSLVSKAGKKDKGGRKIFIDDDDEAGETPKKKDRPNERRAERRGPAANAGGNVHPKGDQPVKNPY